MGETHRRAGRPAGRPLRRGNRQPFPPLGPSALENETSVLGAHAHQEPMSPGPALAIRLERTLHDVRSPGAVEERQRNVNSSEPSTAVSING